MLFVEVCDDELKIRTGTDVREKASLTYKDIVETVRQCVLHN